MTKAQAQQQLDSICGPAPKQKVMLTGIQKRALDADALLEDISDEYQKTFTPITSERK
jgi:hypothetical protein